MCMPHGILPHGPSNQELVRAQGRHREEDHAHEHLHHDNPAQAASHMRADVVVHNGVVVRPHNLRIEEKPGVMQYGPGSSHQLRHVQREQRLTGPANQIHPHQNSLYRSSA